MPRHYSGLPARVVYQQEWSTSEFCTYFDQIVFTEPPVQCSMHCTTGHNANKHQCVKSNISQILDIRGPLMFNIPYSVDPVAEIYTYSLLRIQAVALELFY